MLTATAEVMILELAKASVDRALWKTGPACIHVGFLSGELQWFIGVMEIANRGSALTSESPPLIEFDEELVR